MIPVTLSVHLTGCHGEPGRETHGEVLKPPACSCDSFMPLPSPLCSHGQLEAPVSPTVGNRSGSLRRWGRASAHGHTGATDKIKVTPRDAIYVSDNKEIGSDSYHGNVNSRRVQKACHFTPTLSYPHLSGLILRLSPPGLRALGPCLESVAGHREGLEERPCPL